MKVFISIALLLGCLSAHSAELFINYDKTAVLLNGPILEDDLIEAFNGLPETVHTIQLDARGGYLPLALQLAEIIHKRGWRTYTYIFCESACTFLYMAGKERVASVGTLFVFHKIIWRGPGSHELPKWQKAATDYYISAGMNPDLAQHIEQNKETEKRGRELVSQGVVTDLRGLEEDGSDYLYLGMDKVEKIFGEEGPPSPGPL